MGWRHICFCPVQNASVHLSVQKSLKIIWKSAENIFLTRYLIRYVSVKSSASRDIPGMLALNAQNSMCKVELSVSRCQSWVSVFHFILGKGTGSYRILPKITRNKRKLAENNLHASITLYWIEILTLNVIVILHKLHRNTLGYWKLQEITKNNKKRLGFFRDH